MRVYTAAYKSATSYILYSIAQHPCITIGIAIASATCAALPDIATVTTRTDRPVWLYCRRDEGRSRLPRSRNPTFTPIVYRAGLIATASYAALVVQYCTVKSCAPLSLSLPTSLHSYQFYGLYFRNSTESSASIITTTHTQSVIRSERNGEAQLNDNHRTRPRLAPHQRRHLRIAAARPGHEHTRQLRAHYKIARTGIRPI